MPSWQIDVRRPACVGVVMPDPILRQRSLKRTWLKQARLLKLRVEPSPQAEVKEIVAYVVVAFRAITTAAAGKSVITINVYNPATFCAM